MKNSHYSTLGKYIIERLYLAGKTQKQLVDEAEISNVTIWKILNGKTPLTVRLSKRIAPVIGVDELELRKVALASNAAGVDELGA